MKIKKEINLSLNKREKSEFPVIMISINDPDFVVWTILFYEETEGVLLHSNNPEDSIGEFLTTLIPFDDKSVWRKFEGEIIIRN